MWKSNEHSKIAGLYELKNTLGRGHFAVVKLAEHVFSGEKVAVKVIDKTKMDQISTDHLYHEVTCMKLVQHPNVVRLYQVIETPSKLYLILELGDGGDMFDYIMRHDKGLHEDKAKEYFAQILSAIAYCHQLHVVHRDLKPENVVFFESQGLVKLTDFGFSNRYRPGEKLSTSCGSLAYSAPEILLGEEYDAPAVDVWSLGVILYMLVCGIAPFNEANDSETLTNIMDCRYKVLDHVSRSCQDLIQQMLIREPSERITLDDIMVHPWLEGTTTNTPTPILSRNNISKRLHQSIIGTMQQGDFACQEEIERALHEDRYDHITSTYFLLAERALMQQELMSSVASMDDIVPESSSKDSSYSSSQPIPNKLRPLSDSDVASKNKLQAIYSVSPPCKQAALFPPANVSASADSMRRRTFSSSSEESNSSLHVKNPSFIREHLTITPRHGFSVAHGGIDALIEEEERSKSQTTTDDENDVADDIRELNPNTLASCLQRTSLQRIKPNDMKRMKKRKSAPVLNEICEEGEVEEDVREKESFYQTNFHPSGRHSISTSTPTTHPHRHPHSGVVDGKGDSFKSGLPPAAYGPRIGRSQRRRGSNRSSSSEASEDEETESRRESSTNLSAVVNLLRRRRDSSDDDDRGHGGRDRRGFGHLDGGTPLDDVAEQDASMSQDVDYKEEENKDMSGSQTPVDQFQLNNSSELRLFKKMINLNANKHKIINMSGVRSRSAESHSSSSYFGVTSSRSSSSSRSSCSSLNNYHRLLGNRGTRRAVRNSSSTRSDTGLVLRCLVTDFERKLNHSKMKGNSTTMTGFDHRSLCSSTSLDHFAVNNDLSDYRLSSSSLPRRKRNKNALKLPPADGPPYIFSPLGEADGPNLKTGSHESLAATKRSNLSLVSSTCSSSKFVVDPVNEVPPSPGLPPVLESAAREPPLGADHPAFTHLTSVERSSKFLESTDNLKHKNIGILTKLNNLKNASQGGWGAPPSDLQKKHTIIHKVKHRDCCAIM